MSGADDASDAPTLPLESVRIELARITARGPAGLRPALAQAAVAACSALRVGRLSVWRFVDLGRAIQCSYLYQPGGHDVFEGALLRVADFPHYFAAMRARRVVPVSDVTDDAIVQEFREPYLEPLGITAMLDAPIYLAGAIDGIVCHEHIGGSRSWTEAEVEFAAAVSETVARLYAEAAQATAERTAGSFERHLSRLEQLAERGRLATGIGHDVGNTLAAVVQAARRLTTDAAGVSLVEGIIAACERGATLTQTLLEMGQSGARRPRVVDPRAILADSGSTLRLLLPADVSLVVEPAPVVSRIFVDAGDVERVLLNLVANARDAMAEGGAVAIRVFEVSRERAMGQSGAFVAFEVCDTGVGMSPATLERAFEPFFTTKGAGGTGLGLTIVQQIVELAGGFVEVESTQHVGTAVRVFLPAIARPAAADTADLSQSGASRDGSS